MSFTEYIITLLSDGRREVVGNCYICYIKHLIYILLLFISFNGVAQNYADKEYYLVDSLDLDELSESDRELLEASLKEYHVSKDPISKVEALTKITENMMHNDWKKYQYFQYNLINKLLSENLRKKDSESLKQHLASALNNLGFIQAEMGEVDQALDLFKRSLKIRKEIGDEDGMSTNYNNIGGAYEGVGEIEKALKYYHKSLAIRKKLGNKVGVATMYNNIGAVLYQQGEIEASLEYHHKSLMLRDKIGDKVGMATSYNNMAHILSTQGENKQSLEYHKKSLQINEEIGDREGMAYSYNNIGLVYDNLGQKEKSITYLLKSLEIQEELQNLRMLASLYSNIGMYYKNNGDNQNGLEYLYKGFEVQEKIHDTKGLAISCGNIGNLIVLGWKDLGMSKSEAITKSMDYGVKGLESAEKLGYIDVVRVNALLLTRANELKGDYKMALKNYKLFIQMRDSINNEETQKAAIRQQTQYEFEKEQIRKENEAKEKARIEAEATTRRNNLQYSLIFLGILVLFGIVLSLGFIKVSPNIAEGLIFFAFLIFFEFVLVFTEPYINDYTDGEPIYTLIANAGIALLIFPLHDKLEDLLKKRIVK
jgi:tetratricopeptide (TPR) repeat protein